MPEVLDANYAEVVDPFYIFPRSWGLVIVTTAPSQATSVEVCSLIPDLSLITGVPSYRLKRSTEILKWLHEFVDITHTMVT
jgi:hypothetical protein